MILQSLKSYARADRQPGPWLGVYAVELAGKVYVTGVVEGGPAQSADIREGDVISEVARHEVGTLPEFYRRGWGGRPARRRAAPRPPPRGRPKPIYDPPPGPGVVFHHP